MALTSRGVFRLRSRARRCPFLSRSRLPAAQQPGAGNFFPCRPQLTLVLDEIGGGADEFPAELPRCRKSRHARRVLEDDRR